MLPQDIICKKRDGQTLTGQEIDEFVQGIDDWSISDGQISALLMAALINGLDNGELTAFVNAIVETGIILNWDSVDLNGPVASVYTMPGVGDKSEIIAAPMLAAFLLIPVLEEYGTRYALTLYVCVAILAVLFVPETELALFYVLVMGYYPVLRVKLNGVKSTLLRWVLKFAVFNAGTVLVYLLLFALLGPAVLDELLADGIGMLAALLAAGNLSFWLCDRALAALTRYYHVILKPKLKKKF